MIASDGQRKEHRSSGGLIGESVSRQLLLPNRNVLGTFNQIIRTQDCGVVGCVSSMDGMLSQFASISYRSDGYTNATLLPASLCLSPNPMDNGSTCPAHSVLLHTAWIILLSTPKVSSALTP